MKKEITYKGTRWYKCDLHLHTTASLCFQDREVTPEQWVNRAIEQGLNNCSLVFNFCLSFSWLKKKSLSNNFIVSILSFWSLVLIKLSTFNYPLSTIFIFQLFSISKLLLFFSSQKALNTCTECMHSLQLKIKFFINI